MYHFALQYDDDANEDHEGRVVVQKRRGSAMISQMLDKTIQLNTEENVRLHVIRLACPSRVLG